MGSGAAVSTVTSPRGPHQKEGSSGGSHPGAWLPKACPPPWLTSASRTHFLKTPSPSHGATGGDPSTQGTNLWGEHSRVEPHLPPRALLRALPHLSRGAKLACVWGHPLLSRSGSRTPRKRSHHWEIPAPPEWLPTASEVCTHESYGGGGFRETLWRTLGNVPSTSVTPFYTGTKMSWLEIWPCGSRRQP